MIRIRLAALGVIVLTLIVARAASAADGNGGDLGFSTRVQQGQVLHLAASAPCDPNSEAAKKATHPGPPAVLAELRGERTRTNVLATVDGPVDDKGNWTLDLTVPKDAPVGNAWIVIACGFSETSSSLYYVYPSLPLQIVAPPPPAAPTATATPSPTLAPAPAAEKTASDSTPWPLLVLLAAVVAAVLAGVAGYRYACTK